MKMNYSKQNLYNVIARTEIDDDGNVYLGFGICCSEGTGEIIYDISPNKELVETAVALMNANNLSSIHFEDYCQDLLE